MSKRRQYLHRFARHPFHMTPRLTLLLMSVGLYALAGALVASEPPGFGLASSLLAILALLLSCLTFAMYRRDFGGRRELDR